MRRQAYAGLTQPPLRTSNCIVNKPQQLRRLLRYAPLQKLEAAENSRQQIIEIMSDAAGELSDGFHLLGLEHPVPGSFKRTLRLAALGNIACDLCKPKDLAVVAVYGGFPASAGDAAPQQPGRRARIRRFDDLDACLRRWHKRAIIRATNREHAG